MRFFDRNWQDRWVGLADILERAMENQFYRLLMCVATVGLILAYVIVGTKLAEPEIFRTSSLIEMTTEEMDRPLEFLEIAVVNRAIENIEKMHSALSVYRKFQPTPIRQDLGYFVSKSALRQWEIELHILRLWMDELRGQPALGAFDLAAESVARLVIWELFPQSMDSNPVPVEGSTWFENVNCKFQAGRMTSSPDDCATTRANPMSLVPWLANRLRTQLKSGPVHWRLGVLADLMKASTDPGLMGYDRVASWPNEGALFGRNLKVIFSSFDRALKSKSLLTFAADFSETAAIRFKRFQVNEVQDSRIQVGLAVVGSCRFPTVEQLKKFEARELVWFQDCEENTVVKPAFDARSFAKLNLNLVMAKVGVRELRLAVKQKWISPATLITELQSQIAPIELGGGKLPFALRTQKTEWLADAGVLLLKAPVETLPFVRFDDAAASQTL
ncbi:MAG: hypothetical protein J0L82_00680 [Deltaproteobacteria bacterium]|nr:hypothetical protein [Deltaproteobacteria bacterium]